MNAIQLPIPSHFKADKANEVFRTQYEAIFAAALAWAKQHGLTPAGSDKKRICVMGIDMQNTFCLSDFELFVGGQSGTGAIDDSVRFTEFVYRNLGVITEMAMTMDTHTMMQIFHQFFWVDAQGNHPAPMTMISLEDVEKGVWAVNPAIAKSVAKGNYAGLQQHALHYTRKLTENGKYMLTIWPHHAMLGGIGHALVSIIEEACFFHATARSSQTDFQIKGGNPLTENYSVLQPEVLDTHGGQPVAQRNVKFIQTLLDNDRIIAAGQAASHCFSWSIDDLLTEILANDPELAKKVYLLRDCTSPVVIPGVVDFTEQANEAFARFEAAGMHVVDSTTPMDQWPDF